MAEFQDVVSDPFTVTLIRIRARQLCRRSDFSRSDYDDIRQSMRLYLLKKAHLFDPARGELYTEPHEYRTVVVDSVDWLERLIWADVCQKRGVESIEDIGYGKGYVFALTNWREVLQGLDALRNERGMAVILIAHAQIERFANPETDTYDRYSPRLHKQASALVQEWCDEVLFATYAIHTKTTDEGFGRKRVQGVGTGERIIRATERPAHLAKNRLNLPDEIPLDYRIYAAFMRGEDPLATTETPAEEGD